MAQVTFTRQLERHFPGLVDMVVDGQTVAEILRHLDRHHPGLRDYVVDEAGALRKHVNVFVNGDLIRDRTSLSDPVDDAAVVHVLQALSGG